MSGVDNLTPQERSERMRRIRSKDTKVELLVRRLVHGLGYRYRLHDRTVPGSPDMVFRSRKKAIFVHGCFWHGHACKLGRMPKSRVAFWLNKIAANRERDTLVLQRIEDMGWRALTLWECELTDRERLGRTIKRFLDA